MNTELIVSWLIFPSIDERGDLQATAAAAVLLASAQPAPLSTSYQRLLRRQ